MISRLRELAVGLDALWEYAKERRRNSAGSVGSMPSATQRPVPRGRTTVVGWGGDDLFGGGFIYEDMPPESPRAMPARLKPASSTPSEPALVLTPARTPRPPMTASDVAAAVGAVSASGKMATQMATQEASAEVAGSAEVAKLPVTVGGQAFGVVASSTGSTVVTRPLTVMLIKQQAGVYRPGEAEKPATGLARAGRGIQSYVLNMVGPDSVSSAMLQLLRTGIVLGGSPLVAEQLHARYGLTAEQSQRASAPIISGFVSVVTAPLTVYRIQRVLEPTQPFMQTWANMFRASGRGQLPSAVIYGLFREVPFWLLFPEIRHALLARFASDQDGRFMKGAKNFAISGASAAMAASFTYPFDGAMKLGIKRSDIMAFPRSLQLTYKAAYRREWRGLLRAVTKGNKMAEQLLMSVAANMATLDALRGQGTTKAGQQELLAQIVAERAQLQRLGVDVRAMGVKELVKAMMAAVKSTIFKGYAGFGTALTIMPLMMGSTLVILEAAQHVYFRYLVPMLTQRAANDLSQAREYDDTAMRLL